MAIKAQEAADMATAQGLSGQDALNAFDEQLSKWYVGRRMDSFIGAMRYYNYLRENGGDLGKMGAELYPTHFGTNGFPEKFLDTKNRAEDQTHHVVAYLSLGINDSRATKGVHTFADSDNPGDVRLGSVAYKLGKVLKNDPSWLQRKGDQGVGALLYTNICLGKANINY